MDTVSSTLTVTFQAPYWVGIWARTSQGVTQYARIVFGAEPRDYDVYAWVLTKHRTLRFSDAAPADMPRACANPKRLQRTIAAQMAQRGVSTKAQQALQQTRQQAALQHKRARSAQRSEQAQQRYVQRQLKKKQKRRGH